MQSYSTNWFAFYGAKESQFPGVIAVSHSTDDQTFGYTPAWPMQPIDMCWHGTSAPTHLDIGLALLN